jgi:hypothetical protein
MLHLPAWRSLSHASTNSTLFYTLGRRPPAVHHPIPGKLKHHCAPRPSPSPHLPDRPFAMLPLPDGLLPIHRRVHRIRLQVPPITSAHPNHPRVKVGRASLHRCQGTSTDHFSHCSRHPFGRCTRTGWSPFSTSSMQPFGSPRGTWGVGGRGEDRVPSAGLGSRGSRSVTGGVVNGIGDVVGWIWRWRMGVVGDSRGEEAES